MKIALVSTYPPYKCGIGKYTKYLANEINRISGCDAVVISEGGTDVNSPFPVYDAYSKKTFYSDILNKILEIKPDVVHFQHALVLFPDTRKFLKLVVETSKIVKKVVVTPHTADTGKTSKIDWEIFYRTITDCGHLIVHNEMCLRSVKHYGISTDSVHVIPHGTQILELPKKAAARKKLNIPENEFIFLILGFIHFYKNHHTVITAFRMMKNKKCSLVIAGNADRETWYNRLYLFALKLISSFNSRIIWHDRYVDDDLIPVYLSAADTLLLPYWQNYPSASGIFHLGIGAKLPILCSDSVKFSEVKKFLSSDELFIPANNVIKWKNAMNSLAENPEKLDKFKDNLFRYAKETSWENVASTHFNIYRP